MKTEKKILADGSERRDGGNRRAGGAMLVVILLVMVATTLVAVYLKATAYDAYVTRKTLDYEKACVAAEAGLDYGVMQLRNVIYQYRLSPSVTVDELQQLLDNIPPPSTPMPPYHYTTPGGTNIAFKIEVTSPIQTGIITNGTTCRGANGAFQYFRITCGAYNPDTGEGAVLQQDVQVVSVYVIRYGVFYDTDLEILPGPTMDFYGRVHSNGDLYLGGPLRFHDVVTAHGKIRHRRKDRDARPGNTKIEDASGTLVSMRSYDAYQFLDSDHPDWMSESLTRWQGNVLSAAHSVAKLRPPIDLTDSPHDIIEPALDPSDPNYHEETEKEKFANKAALTIHVADDGSVTFTDFFGNDVSSHFTNAVLQPNGVDPSTGKTLYAKDSNKEYEMNQAGSYDVTQTFYDGREKKTMAPVDIYVDQLMLEFPELYDGTYSYDEGRGVVYVTRDDPTSGEQPCVRIRNGREILPYLGVTVATDLPAYLEGDFNTEDTKPAMIAGDAVTLLSKNWQDARSTLNKRAASRAPANTTYKAVIMTGNLDTEWGSYNGGLENELRFLEHWTSSRTVTFRGSIINLWNSEIATGEWNGSYYTPPRRNWGYDNIYRTQNPPGMTKVCGMEEIRWKRISWADAPF